MAKKIRRPSLTSASPLGPAFWWGLGLVALLSLLFQFGNWDRLATLHFYKGNADLWPGRQWGWSQALYRFGEYPASIVGALGALGFGLSFVDPRWRAWRGPGLFLSLLLILGPGLLVNGLLKALCGRPRPSESQNFGGLWAFQRPWHLGLAGRGTSFVSGHAANAWYFLGFFFLLKGARRWLALGAALLFGAAMSLARVSQGAHWLSDTLIAGLLLWTLAAALRVFIHWQPRARFFKKKELWLVLGIGLIAFASLSHVRFEDRRFVLMHGQPQYPPPPQQRLVNWDGMMRQSFRVDVELQASNLWVYFDNRPDSATPLNVETRFHGQAWPGARESTELRQSGQSAWTLEQQLRGWWISKAGGAWLSVAGTKELDLRLHTQKGLITIGPLPPGRKARVTGIPANGMPPPDFERQPDGSWAREGAEPMILIDLKATDIRFTLS